ncbi:MAG: hypothetical protein MUO75_04725, partial [Actinobacteria bacterium]|nr:hypothetical protein [Actinomycetota bacterium]
QTLRVESAYPRYEISRDLDLKAFFNESGSVEQPVGDYGYAGLHVLIITRSLPAEQLVFNLGSNGFERGSARVSLP